MGWFGDKEFLVDLISYASIVSAAIFGLLALFTDYKKDGTITRWGRVAAGGIAMSAVFAMTSAVLQKQIASDEQAAGEAAATEQRRRQQAQFDEQIGQLRNLDGQMRRVNEANRTLLGSMEESLASQGVLLANARRSMLMTAGVGMQEQRNTQRVIRTMWTDANRIGSSSIEIFVSYGCAMRQDAVLPPLLMAGAEATLGLRPASYLGPRGSLDAELPFTGERYPPTALRGPLLLGEYGAIRLSAVPHDFHSFNRVNYDGENFFFTTIHSMRVGPFYPTRVGSFRESGLGQFSTPEGWVGTSVEILITAPVPTTDRPLAALFSNELGGEDEVVARFPGTRRRWGRNVLPCASQVTLLVNGRVVAEPPSAIVLLPTEEGGRPPTLVLKSHIVLVDSAALPRFVD